MLSIVIPALNEEQSIESICTRCLQTASLIREKTGHEIEILVVDDGSTDQTAALARAIEGVTVLSFGRNRGYGAALMAGFSKGNGELVGFLDADGTCEPKYFVELILAVEDGASLALGNRLGSESQMPRIRRIGNLFFAWLIRLLSGASVQDSASGMRVIKRDCLELLYPLPEGLHFTPAMSCRAALDPRLSLAEVAMSYAERCGQSKLAVISDGYRFLRVILEIAITYRPLLIFGAFGALALLCGLAYALGPILTFWETGTLPIDRVYRVITILVLTASGIGFLYAGALAERAQSFVNPSRPQSRIGKLVRTMFFARPFLLAGSCFLAAVATNAKALYQYLSTGSIQVHWATIAFGAILALAAGQLLAFGVLQRVLGLLSQRVSKRDE